MIPKRIHYCWFGGNPLPELAKKCIDSWKKFLPDYEIVEWNENNFDISFCKYAREAYESKKWSFVSDYARLKIIYENGGIYLDTDVEVVKNMDVLLNQKALIGFENEKSVNSGNIIASEKGNSVIKEMLDVYESLSFKNEDGSLNLTACPVYNTEILINRGLVQNNTLQFLNDVTVYPTEYFCAKNYDTGILTVTDNTYSIHHFDGSWISKNLLNYMNKRKQIMEKGGKFANIRCSLCFLNYKIKEYGFSYLLRKAFKVIFHFKEYKHEFTVK